MGYCWAEPGRIGLDNDDEDGIDKSTVLTLCAHIQEGVGTCDVLKSEIWNLMDIIGDGTGTYGLGTYARGGFEVRVGELGRITFAHMSVSVSGSCSRCLLVEGV